MRKLVISLAAIAVAGFALPMTAPANAQDVDKTVIIKRDGDRDFDRPRTTKKVIIKRDGDRDFDRRRTTKKVIIKQGDRGNHYGWRNRHSERVVIKRRERDENVGVRVRGEGGSVTVKKRIDLD
jgi:hypothetical protein